MPIRARYLCLCCAGLPVNVRYGISAPRVAAPSGCLQQGDMRQNWPCRLRPYSTLFCAGLVCLSMCGFVSGNRARLSGRAASPSTRPLGVYIYAVGPRSCRIRRAQKGSARIGPTKLRFCSKTLFLWAFRSAFSLAPQNATRFSAVTRPETKPCLAPSGVRRGARGLGLSRPRFRFGLVSAPR